ncbi:MAG TPA: permease [Syntrophales bacterium]|nr:permease [Syntrophales bacterium]
MDTINNFIAAGKFFLVIAGELILIFIAVSFLVGILTEYLPPSRIRTFLSDKLTWVQYFLGAGLGALTPFCSCSTVPITAGLLKGGVPFGPTMAFLFSSPVLNPIIIALLLSLLGYKVTVLYVTITFFGSMGAALLLAKLGMENQVKALVDIQPSCCAGEANPAPQGVINRPAAAACCAADSGEPSLPPLSFPILPASGACCLPTPALTKEQATASSCCEINFAADNGAAGREETSFRDKLKRASAAAMDTFKDVFWYLLLGAAIGAFIYGFFPQEVVMRWAGPDNPWSIPVAALIGVPMYIRAETVIPISAALVGKGMGVGTVLALIIGGAGASIPEMIILASMFKKRLIIAFVLNVFLVAVAAGYLVDLLMY